MKSPIVPIERVLDLVSAYVANNRISPEAVPAFIEGIFETVVRLQAADDQFAWVDEAVEVGAIPAVATTAEPVAEAPGSAEHAPAVPVADSVHFDHLVCLEDGKPFKSLRRHLRTSHGLTADEYRRRWGLPFDYPMVCGEYASTRSDVAKKTGLGRNPRKSRPARRRVTR